MGIAFLPWQLKVAAQVGDGRRLRQLFLRLRSLLSSCGNLRSDRRLEISGDLLKAEGFEIRGAVFALELIDEGGKGVVAVFAVVPVHRRTAEVCDTVEDTLNVGIGEAHWVFVRKVAVAVALVGIVVFIFQILAHVGHGTGGGGGGGRRGG